MYGADIQTTLSIRGHLVFIEYRVTEEWAVEWWLNIGAYQMEDDIEEVTSALNLLDTLLRTYEHERIESDLLDEFESRQYEQEQAFAAQLAHKDIPF